MESEKIRDISSKAQIGHIHLNVSNLERSIKFCSEVPGFEMIARMGSQAAFLASGGHHHMC
jgi:catechol 2,3-dioxygenase